MDEKIEIKGWKGKDDIQISERKDCYVIYEHRKSKETGETYTETPKRIPKENINILLEIIEANCDYNTEYKYRYLVRKILERYNFHKFEGLTIEQMMESFNGGKNRAKYYFPYLYYPLKVLEVKGIIAYFGRGGIMRLQ